MARSFLTGLRLVNLASDPATGSEGELYYNTVTDKVRLYSNGAWIDVVSASSGSLFNVDAIAYPDYITFDTTPELSSNAVGTIYWDPAEGGLIEQATANLSIVLNQENSSLVYNAEATTLNKGEVVYLFGAQGQRPSVKRASNDSDTTSAKTFGMVAESIASGAEGHVITQGIIKNVDTNAYNQGDILWLGTNGGLTTTKPYAPTHMVFVGVVLKKNASSGRIFVKPQNGYEMDELHNVYAQAPSDNDILSYVSASTMWVKQNLATAITEVDGTGSGIDADLLDGQHGSYYQDAGNLNAGTLLAARMPALTGDITTTVGTVATTLANTTVVAASYGSASAVPTFTVDSKGRLTSASNTTIAIAQSAVTSLVSDLSLKAPLASPTLTGTPTAPTASVGTNTTQIATTAYVMNAVPVEVPHPFFIGCL